MEGKCILKLKIENRYEGDLLKNNFDGKGFIYKVKLW